MFAVLCSLFWPLPGIQANAVKVVGASSYQLDFFSGQLRQQHLYLAVYGLDLPNPFVTGSTGTLIY
jgi:hypothetical protein